jgi:hypothetical protein
MWTSLHLNVQWSRRKRWPTNSWVCRSKESGSRALFSYLIVITSKILRLPPWLVDRYGICVTNDHGYVLLVVNTSLSFPHSRPITGFVTRLTRRVPLVEQELLTLPEQLSSPPNFSGVRVTRSLVVYVCFVDRCLFFFDIRILIAPLVSSNSFFNLIIGPSNQQNLRPLFSNNILYSFNFKFQCTNA